MTVRQSRLVDRGGQSINSDSSSQSFAESRACSGPNNSFTAPMNDANSMSEMYLLCISQIVKRFILVHGISPVLTVHNE